MAQRGPKNPRRKLTDDQLERMVVLRERGRGYLTIAAELGVSAAAIHYQCLRLGVVSPRQRRRPSPITAHSFVAGDGRAQRRFTAEEDRRLLAAESEGLNYGQIARRLGRPITSVRIRLMTLALREDLPA